MSHLLRIVLQEVLHERELQRHQLIQEEPQGKAQDGLSLHSTVRWEGIGVFPPRIVTSGDTPTTGEPECDGTTKTTGVPHQKLPFAQRSSPTVNVKAATLVPTPEPRSQQALNAEQRFLSRRFKRYGKHELVAWGPKYRHVWEAHQLKPQDRDKPLDENQQPPQQQLRHRKPTGQAIPPRRKFHIGVHLPNPCTKKEHPTAFKGEGRQKTHL